MSVWATLLETAIHSPSPHNVQPWRVRIKNDGEAELLIDSGRTLPKEDPTGIFIILTMGMFIEALSLLAANHQHQLEYELLHEPEWYAGAILETQRQVFLPFARLRLDPKDNLETNAYERPLFKKRRTSRLAFSPEPVPNEIVAKLQELAAGCGQRYEQTTDRELIERILAQ